SVCCALRDRLPEPLKLWVREELLVQLARLTFTGLFDVLADVRATNEFCNIPFIRIELLREIKCEAQLIWLELRRDDAIVDKALCLQMVPDCNRPLVSKHC